MSANLTCRSQGAGGPDVGQEDGHEEQGGEQLGSTHHARHLKKRETTAAVNRLISAVPQRESSAGHEFRKGTGRATQLKVVKASAADLLTGDLNNTGSVKFRRIKTLVQPGLCLTHES